MTTISNMEISNILKVIDLFIDDYEGKNFFTSDYVKTYKLKEDDQAYHSHSRMLSVTLLSVEDVNSIIDLTWIKGDVRSALTISVFNGNVHSTTSWIGVEEDQAKIILECFDPVFGSRTFKKPNSEKLIAFEKANVALHGEDDLSKRRTS